MALAQSIGTASAVAYHEGLASTWDGRYASGGFQRRGAFFEAAILPRLRVAGREWVDIGCGSGYFARLLSRTGARVLGVDGSAAMIEAARRLADSEGCAQIGFAVVPSLERLDLDDESVDGCLCLSVLEYLENPQACLAEMARIVRPGGQVAVSAPDRWSPVRRLQSLRHALGSMLGLAQPSYLDSSKNAWTPGELDQMAAACGLASQATAGFDPILPEALRALFAPSLRFAVWIKPQS